MKISTQWLRTLADPGADTAALAHSLTMAGLKVDAIEAIGEGLDAVLVGEVLAVEPHPDADSLTVCHVAVGGDETRTIVCGADNVHAGMRAPVVLPGATLPGGHKIGVAKLRGVRSEGMLCSGRELGLSDDHAGLLELPESLVTGMSLVDALGLDDEVLELDLTPNRGDCMSALGVAREIAAIHGLPAPLVDCAPVAATIEDARPVVIADADDCPIYCGRIVRGADPARPSPVWMQERLRRAGIRPQGAAVDVTAYVMLELGQPLHAFDDAGLSGAVAVRRGNPGEKLVLLDGTEVEVDAEVLVIADDTGPVALAGVMGGARSSVTDGTRDLFLESAHFTPLAVSGRARRYGLHTDAAQRFERGVDPSLPLRALERATALLVDIAGGRPGPVTVAGTAVDGMRPDAVTLRHARLELLLGQTFDAAQVLSALERLGLEATGDDAGWSVRVPWHRFDLLDEADLVEEVARLVGYDHIPSRDAMMPMVPEPTPDDRVPVARIEETLIQRGFQQVITYSFVAPELQRRLGLADGALDLSNPISAELAQMRTSLWPGLIECLRYNVARQQSRVRIFETGLRFITQDNDLQQEPTLAALIWGDRYAPQWALRSEPVDFHDLKGVAEAILAAGGTTDGLRFEAAAHPSLHPGQSARIVRDGLALGWIGTLHPAHAQALDLPRPPVLLELGLEPLAQGRTPAARAVSRFPAVRRDLALVVPESVTVGALLEAVDSAAPEALVERFVFDIYRGKGIEPGLKSIALGLILQETSRTLTDSEADGFVDRLVAGLGRSVNATLRD